MEVGKEFQNKLARMVEFSQKAVRDMGMLNGISFLRNRKWKRD